MFDTCHTTNANPKCTEVAEKIVQIFGWRHTYNVEKLQRNVPARETTRISITRPTAEYIKTSVAQSPDSWVSVHNLQSQGGGILDPDDRLSDVADDREQILASFEDRDGAHHHGGGDGASGSSVGTGSPDIFHDGDLKYCPSYPRTDIEVTGEQLASGCSGSLQVRRGSEPALNQLPIGPPPPNDHNKRWSAAPIILEPPNISFRSNDWSEDSREEDEEPGFKRITRDGSNRLSMQFLGDGVGYRWAEAAEKANARSHTSLPRENKRKEPLGQANSTSPVYGLDNRSELIVIRNELGPLGIHVVPDYDTSGKDKGLLVQGIEPGGRIDRDGRLAVFDRIIEINGQNLLNMPFQRVQELFKLSLTSPELRLRVIRCNNSTENFRKPPAPVYPKFPDDKENVSMHENEQKQGTKVATVSPTKKVPGVSRNLKSLLQANTRKIGRKIEIELTKGPHGLGFSITTRDNPAGGNCPIYIKNIIPKGAAVEDGRLRIGDRLLEVNGVEMTGKSQSEAVAVLRNAPAGSKVKIVVSRQEDVNEMNLPRIIGVDEIVETEEETNEATRDENTPPTIPPLPQSHLQSRTPDKNTSVAKIISQFQEAAANISNPPEKSDDNSQFPWKHKEILTFNIPVHDSEKAGLGISVKGKTSASQDLGIFIKSVIHGGAASRDRRLKTNDQLLNVNGISLLQQSNSDAMVTLRNAMYHTEGPVPGNITLTIARRASSPAPSRNFNHRASDSIHNNSSSELGQSNETEPSITDNSGASAESANTVIFNPNKSISSSKSVTNQPTSPMNTWNPVLDRLMGNKNQQLRNESYYRATHDTWNATMFADQTSPNAASTTVNLQSGEPILIEDEYGSRVLPQQISRTKITINNTLNTSANGTSSVENRSEHEPDGKASLSGSNCDNKSTESSQVTTNDATYASQLSLENPAGFSRDAFGRQSMSEKRHATLDAKSTDTYQRTKKLREERDKTKNLENADKLGQLGPSLGMKKSSSLESLQTMVQEIQMQEEGDPAYSYRGPSGALKVIRGKGCEESFRAAVVDPNHRSEITAKKHWLLDPPVDEREIDGFSNVRGGPRQSSLNAAIDGKHKVPKKKPGIFKGIGSMFRFGKHRKMEPEMQQHYQQTTEFDNEQVQVKPHEESTHSISKQNDTTPNERVREYDHREPLYQRHGFVHHHAEQVQVIPEGAAVTSSSRYSSSSQSVDHNQNRGERTKSQNQRYANRQHMYYSAEDRDAGGHYDQVFRRRNEQTPSKYGEYGRPGSRSGITESVPFTHYVNYNELQNHLSRKQHQYHSQRQPRQDNQLRPVSNYYEYETFQSVLNSRGVRPGMQPSIQPPPYQDPNSNSLTRQQVHGRGGATRSHHTPHRGPFVTHVTIGDHSQQNGTKV